MPPDGDYLIAAVDLRPPARGSDYYLAYNMVVGTEAAARGAAALAQLAPRAERIHARQGTTIKTTLTVRR